MFPCVPASSPETVSAAFADAINARDLPAALGLWMDDAAIIGPEGESARGRDAIAAALQGLLESQVTLRIDIAEVYRAGGVAIATGTFATTGTRADGERFEAESDCVVIYAHASDGWRIAIDAPWGLPRT
jgi:uncharacterized protein (TIGR02246 family)